MFQKSERLFGKLVLLHSISYLTARVLMDILKHARIKHF